jgi:hypothetical protein
MAEQQSVVPAPRGAVSVTTCWMCGIRLYPGHMMADGGSACTDLRWYCLDVRSCTERWTSRVVAGSAGIGPGAAESGGGTGPAPSLPRRLASASSGPASRSQ